MKKWSFGVLMAAFMTYGMEVYNAVLRQGGFAPELLLPSWQTAFIVPLVMLVQLVFGGPAAASLQKHLLKGRKLAGGRQLLVNQLCMVLFMCPAMSLAAVFIFKGGLQPEFFTVWGRTVLFNAPMALAWQIMVAGPVVRFLVGLLPEHEFGLKRAAQRQNM